jgi:hypothetical protein
VARAAVGIAVRLGRGQVQHPRRQIAQARQRGGLVEVGNDRHRAGGAQIKAALGLAGQRKHAKTPGQQRQQAHADVAATDDQQARTGKSGAGWHGHGRIAGSWRRQL